MRKHELELLEVFEPYRGIFEESVKEFVKISGCKGKTEFWESKFGGNPYMPMGYEYPKDNDGTNLRLLAQINFEEAPNIDCFPSKGILQFYISPIDDCYGCDNKNKTNQNKFKVVYFKDVMKDHSKLISNFDFLESSNNNQLPFTDECRLKFDIDSKPVSSSDFNFIKLFGEEAVSFFDQVENDNLVDDDWVYDFELYDWYAKNYSSSGHKMGGYASFTQTDPRHEERYKEFDVLLLQIDTDKELGIAWGDYGVANFFIKRENLINLDFNNVMYTYDCC